MVGSVSSTSSSGSTASTQSAASKSLSANYDMFLQLLATQLKTQNPLDPMDSTEFTKQLATYASLEQQISTNDKLDSVLSEFNTLSLSTGVGYMGRTIEADTDTVAVGADGSVGGTFNYTLDTTAKAVTLKVVDAQGNAVWSAEGQTGEGTHELAWTGVNGKGKAVPAGDYTLQVTATDSAGKDITSSVAIKGKVTAVDTVDGDTVLEIGGTKVKLSSVTRLAS